VARIEAIGPGVTGLAVGGSAGIPWLGHTCGTCAYCRSRENLCDAPLFTGYTRDGGFATAVIADARFAFPLGEEGSDVALAPLLCRADRLALAEDGGRGARLHLWLWRGGHIVAQVARWQGREVFAHPPGRHRSQDFARSLGATWAGGSDEMPPEPLDAAIICGGGRSAPQALRAVHKGGRVVCAGIHMSDIPAFPYDILWGERQLLSVANLTREDGVEFRAGAADRHKREDHHLSAGRGQPRAGRFARGPV
jgi:propanol-preferring alcohol dehydrogenase